METLQLDPETTEIAVKSPKGLRFLCVLSWIIKLVIVFLACGLAVGGNKFVQWVNFPVADTILRDDAAGNMFYMLIKILVALASGLAVLWMWRMQKKGFWMFVGMEGLLLLLPWIFLNPLGVGYLLVKSLMSLVFSLFIIFLFALYFKKLK